jgi:sugar lactone lactonase YvrE
MFTKSKSTNVILSLLVISQFLFADKIAAHKDKGDQEMDQGDNQTRLELIYGDLFSSGTTDGFGKTARFVSPQNLALDNNGNIFVSEYSESYRTHTRTTNHLIRKITTQGEVSTVAGTAGFIEHQSNPGRSATLNRPAGLVLDTTGNVYVADVYNHCIRKIAQDKIMSTFAGVCGESGGEDGPLGKARFFFPRAMAVDKDGFLYVGDSTKIRKISPGGDVTTLAGDKKHYDIKDGVGNSAGFNNIRGLSFNSHGFLYVADFRFVRRVSMDGTVSTLEFKYKDNIAIDSLLIEGLTVDPQDNIYVTSKNAIYKILPTGELSLFAGDPDACGREGGDGRAARFCKPLGLSSDVFGNIYVADSYNVTIRKITPEGIVSTLAGPQYVKGMSFLTNESSQVVIDSKGNIVTAHRGLIDSISTTMVKKITPEGARSQVNLYLSGEVHSLAIDSSNNIYLSERKDAESQGNGGGSGYSPLPRSVIEFFREKGYSKIYKISPSGRVTKVVGKTSDIFHDTTVDAEGNIYIAASDQIKKIIPRKFWLNKTQVIVEYSRKSINVDRDKPSKKEYTVAYPISLITDEQSNLYFIERSYTEVRTVDEDHIIHFEWKSGVRFKIKKITPSGKVTVIAGSDQAIGAVDGMGASASFDNPKSLSVDSNNNLYVLESGLQTIRRIEPNGNVTTIVGQSGVNKFIEGALPGALENALSITVHGNSLYIVLNNGLALVRNLPE